MPIPTFIANYVCGSRKVGEQNSAQNTDPNQRTTREEDILLIVNTTVAGFVTHAVFAAFCIVGTGATPAFAIMLNEKLMLT